MIRLDLHVHTQYSYDSKTTLKQVFRAAEKAGLDGVAITDHGTVEGALRALRLKPKIFVVPGMEVDAKGGHILALGVRERVPEGLSVLETVERIRELGGLAVASHLYAFFKSCHWSLEELSSFDAIEVINASAIPFGRSTRRSFRVARALGLPMVAGSDAHIPEAIGYAYTVVDAETSLDDVLEAIRKGRTQPVGRATPILLKLKKWMAWRPRIKE